MTVAHTYEQFLQVGVGLGLGLVFVHLFRFSILCVFWFSYFVLVLFAFVVLGLCIRLFVTRTEYSKDPNKNRQTGRQTDRQTLQLIPQQHSNAHDIQKSHSTCPKMFIHYTR